MKKPILISVSHFGTINSAALDDLENAGFRITLNRYDRKLDPIETIELLKGKVAMIAGTEPLKEDVFSQCEGLKYICRFGTGMDNVDLDSARSHGITVDNLPDTHVQSVAELTIGAILSTLRKLPLAHATVRSGVWNKAMGSLLQGRKVGLVGLGKVSKTLVGLLRPFNVEILANDLKPDKAFAETNGIALLPLNNLLDKSEILSLHIPYSSENHHLIGKKELEIVRRDIKIINTSRGGLIDEEALFSFLKENPDSFAYLDTMSAEPYHGPLITLENIFFSPHIGTFTKETRLQMELEAVHKTIQFFKRNG